MPFFVGHGIFMYGNSSIEGVSRAKSRSLLLYFSVMPFYLTMMTEINSHAWMKST